jgi:PilZ domain
MADDATINTVDRRKKKRTPLGLIARYKLANGKSYRGWIANSSAGGLLLAGPGSVQVGERVVVEVDGLGQLDGEIVRLVTDGFAIRLLDDESTVATAIALMVAARYSDV